MTERIADAAYATMIRMVAPTRAEEVVAAESKLWVNADRNKKKLCGGEHDIREHNHR